MKTITKRLRVLLGIACLMVVHPLTAHAAPRAGDLVELIGARVTDVKGRHHRIGVSAGKVQPVALVFLDTACPVATRYVPELNEIQTTRRRTASSSTECSRTPTSRGGKAPASWTTSASSFPSSWTAAVTWPGASVPG